MKSSSLNLITKHGIKNPAEYRDTLVHSWYLSDETSSKLEVFFQRKLETDMLFRMIRDGEITVGRKEYSVIWIDSPLKIRKVRDALISFRYCPLLKCGYALVKELKGTLEIDYLATEETNALVKELK